MKNDTGYTKKQIEAMRFIRNNIINYGKAPSVRALMDALGYSSPRSAALVINELLEKGLLKKRGDGSIRIIKNIEEQDNHARTINVPMIGSISCGSLMLAEENIEGFIPVSSKLTDDQHKYFLLKARGDSMNKAGINDGDVVLVKQQPIANNGEIVVALIDDEATLKEIHLSKEAIVLKPVSKNKEHKPIIVSRDFKIQGIVKAVIPEFNK
jgi:repressor LexA